jgi:hypothetical protein
VEDGERWKGAPSRGRDSMVVISEARGPMPQYLLLCWASVGDVRGLLPSGLDEDFPGARNRHAACGGVLDQVYLSADAGIVVVVLPRGMR